MEYLSWLWKCISNANVCFAALLPSWSREKIHIICCHTWKPWKCYKHSSDLRYCSSFTQWWNIFVGYENVFSTLMYVLLLQLLPSWSREKIHIIYRHKWKLRYCYNLLILWQFIPMWLWCTLLRLCVLYLLRIMIALFVHIVDICNISSTVHTIIWF
jgi:hypothetical protein